MNTPLSLPALPPLTSQERSRLRAAAHALSPVVLLGDRGLTDAVLKEIDRALTAHHLIKVRAAAQERDERTQMLADICTRLACHPVHHLGKMLVLYRPMPVAEPASNPLARKPGAPYVTKKRAALDQTANPDAAAKKPAGKVKTPAQTSAASAGKKPVAGKPRKPAAATSRTTASRTRGPGSALTLRAGARSSASRPIARTVGAKKTAVRKTSARSR